MKKVIIICHEPLTERIKSNFYINDIVNAGFDLVYWDISQYVYPGITLTGEVSELFITKFDSFEQIENQLGKEDLAKSLFIIEVIMSWQNRYLFKLLSDFHCQMIRIDMYGNTDLHIPFGKKIRQIELKNILKVLNRRLESMLFNFFLTHNQVKGYECVFSSSAYSDHRIPINHPDFELNIQCQKDEIGEEFIVFLDVFYPLHPDLFHMIKTQDISASAYRDSLNGFFSKVERLYGIPVVIAAHPKADYTGVEFENRIILRGRTVELVRKSALVLLHSSNSVSFAILNDKPFGLITNSEYSKVSYLRSAQNRLAYTLDKIIFDVDKDELTKADFSKMNPLRRQEYIYTYLTSPKTEMLLNKDIILSYLLSDE